MRDIHVLHWYPNFLGGGAVSAAVSALAKGQRAKGARVTIAALETRAAPIYEPVEAGSGVEILTWRPGGSVSFAGKRLHFLSRPSTQRLRALGPDVVHVHGELNPDNLWVPRLFHCPIVLSPHGAFHPNAISHGNWLLKRLHLPVARRLLYSRVSLFDALGPAEADHIRALLPGAPVVVIPHGANPRIAEVARGENGAGRRDRSGEVRLVSVARLDIFTKGLDILLEAFAAASKALPQRRLSLTIIGPDQGGAKRRLLAQARALGIEHRLSLPGSMAFAQVWQCLKDSDLFVLLSRRDGFGNTVIEAALAGKPVVVSTEVGAACFPELTALPHLIRVRPQAGAAASAIIDAIGRLEDLSASALADRDRVRALFSWDTAARRLLDGYAELLSSGERAFSSPGLTGAAPAGT